MDSDNSQQATTISALTDEQLLLDFQKGDQAAFAAIVERHELRLARIAYRIVGRQHEAEDVRHAVFVRFLQFVSQPHKLERVGAWLTRCTINEAFTRVRKHNQDERVRGEIGPLSQVSENSSPLEKVQADELRDQLSSYLARLSPDARALLSLRFDEDLTFQEIAELLDRPTSTVKSQVSRAIAQLRESLSANQ